MYSKCYRRTFLLVHSFGHIYVYTNSQLNLAQAAAIEVTTIQCPKVNESIQLSQRKFTIIRNSVHCLLSYNTNLLTPYRTPANSFCNGHAKPSMCVGVNEDVHLGVFKNKSLYPKVSDIRRYGIITIRFGHAKLNNSVSGNLKCFIK